MQGSKSLRFFLFASKFLRAFPMITEAKNGHLFADTSLLTILAAVNTEMVRTYLKIYIL